MDEIMRADKSLLVDLVDPTRDIVDEAVNKLRKKASQEFVKGLDAINQSYIERLPSVFPLE